MSQAQATNPPQADDTKAKKDKKKKDSGFIPIFRWPEIRLGLEWEFDNPADYARDQVVANKEKDSVPDTRDRPLAHSIGFTIPKANYGIKIPPKPAIKTDSSSKLRRLFPALSRYSDTAFTDNASSTPLPQVLMGAMQEAMITTYANSGLPTTQGKAAARAERRGHSVMTMLFNSDGLGTVALGASTTQLSERLASMCDYVWSGEGEVVLSSAAHASVRGPFEALGNRGIKIREWDPTNGDDVTPLDTLKKELGPKTNLVVLSHVNSITGEIADLPAIVTLVRETARNAKILVEGSLYAQHRLMDLEAWGVDYYVVSLHKMYGPHLGALFLSTAAAKELTGPNHAFVEVDDWPRKFELGTLSSEACAGVEALQDFYAQVAGVLDARPPTTDNTESKAGNSNNLRIDRPLVQAVFERVGPLEQLLCRQLVKYLRSVESVTVYGKHGPDGDEMALDDERVLQLDKAQIPVVAFTHRVVSTEAIWKALSNGKVAACYGHCYCPALCGALGIDPAKGVVRISFGMFNTTEDVEKIVGILRAVLV